MPTDSRSGRRPHDLGLMPASGGAAASVSLAPPPAITGDGFCLQRSEDCARDSGILITRYHLVLSVPASTIRGMAGDQETVTAAAAVTAGGDLVPRAGARPPGPAAIAAELLARTRAELPVLAGLGKREELLAAAWLASLRAPRTRRAYAADMRGWLGWLAAAPMCWTRAGRTWTCRRPGRTAARSPPPCAAAVGAVQLLPLLRRVNLVDRHPDGGGGAAGSGPGLHRHHRPGLRPGARPGRSRRRRPGPAGAADRAVIRLLLHNALRVDEACAADVADLGADAGHRGAAGGPQGRPESENPADPGDGGRAGRLPCGPGPPRRARRRAAAGRPAAGRRQRRTPPPGAPVGTGPPPGPRRGHPGLGPAVPALPAALGDHLRPRRRRRAPRRQDYAGTTAARPAGTTTATAWTATPPTP